MTHRTYTLQEIDDALRHVDPHDRDVWVQMAMAVKSEFGDAGWDTWDAWSQTGSNYKAADANSVWRSVKAGGGVGIGTLIKAAKDAGWSPPDDPLDEAEQQRREAEAQRRRIERQARERAQAEHEAALAQAVADMSTELWTDYLANVGRRAKYLGAKKVRGHGLKFANRGVVALLDTAEPGYEIISDRKALEAWWQDPRKDDRERYSWRYLKQGTLAVPMRGLDGKLYGLQLIFEAGAKKFFRHARKQGTCHVIGTLQKRGVVALAEGYATGASIHEAMAWPVVVCWDAGNLDVVAGELHERYPELDLVVCGDDDHEGVDAQGNPRNAGREKAGRAASRVGGISLFPTFQEPAGQSDWNDLHVAEGLEAVRRQLQAGIREAEAAREAAAAGGEDAEGASTPGPASLWESRLARTKEGALKAGLYNVITILENHEAFRGLYAMDGFANQVQRTRAAPYGKDAGEVTELDGAELAAWLGDPANYGLGVGSKLTLEAIETVAARRMFHPVRDYLDALQWDGTERLPTFFSDFFGTPSTEYTQRVAMIMLLSAVARVRSPGCKVDTMVILEGPQGEGKSTAVRTLCGPDWFAETMESPQGKDFFQVLSGRWIVEIPELQSFNKADRNKIKAAVSAQEDTYRPSYGRYARQFPRQNIFIGTTNDDAYLRDPTGARRFLPVLCKEIHLEAIARLRDQLWAEADVRYRRGEDYWTLPEEAKQMQEERFDVDVWEDPIRDWVDGHAPENRYPDPYQHVTPRNPVREVTISTVMLQALGVEVAKQTRPEQMRVAEVLKRLGFKKGRQRAQPDGRRPHVYERPREDSG